VVQLHEVAVELGGAILRIGRRLRGEDTRNWHHFISQESRNVAASQGPPAEANRSETSNPNFNVKILKQD
jgi:hypothetical protein